MLRFLITLVAVCLAVEGMVALCFPRQIEKLLREFLPGINVRQMAVAELTVGLFILILQMILNGQ